SRNKAIQQESAPDTNASKFFETLRFWHQGMLWCIGALLSLNLLLNLVAGAIGEQSAAALALRTAGRSLPPHQALAATDWDSGLTFAYWNDARYFGLAQG